VPSLPLAHLITFRTYATWLHGDGRYSMHHRRMHGYQSPALTPSPAWRAHSRSALKNEPVVLDEASRAVVDSTVIEVCAQRGWALLAVNARTNHVHVVLRARQAPEEAMATLKAWCTRRLREAGHVPPDGRVWAQRGSTRYLWTERAVEGAVRYVVEGQ
jgi:REP element-mobilizing transposase RayT